MFKTLLQPSIVPSIISRQVTKLIRSPHTTSTILALYGLLVEHLHQRVCQLENGLWIFAFVINKAHGQLLL
jgi:hypothetical protein